ncbi:cell division protein FtsQ/DivIB [Holzapfeliella sp. He02]|uniref:Cell division protein FtsQ/DivIB n=1 Tax=Holzapfeliella saturejae TaxID=3082953 RepID=A0ABU8SG20_9LACO
MGRHKKQDKSKKFTKKDPRQELDGWISQKGQEVKNKPEKASHRLTQLKSQRRRSLVKKLLLIFTIAILVILASLYYMSPISNVSKVDINSENIVSKEELEKLVVFNPNDKVLVAYINQGTLSHKINEGYPSIARLDLKINNYNELQMTAVPAEVIGYFQTTSGYQRIVSDGRVSPEYINEPKDHIIYYAFQGDNYQERLSQTIDLINKLPDKVKTQVAKVRVDGLKQNQIVLVMKDNNIVLGSQDTIIDKMNYYDKIKEKLASQKYLIDFEVGYFAQPLSDETEKNYNNSL